MKSNATSDNILAEETVPATLDVSETVSQTCGVDLPPSRATATHIAAYAIYARSLGVQLSTLSLDTQSWAQIAGDNHPPHVQMLALMLGAFITVVQDDYRYGDVDWEEVETGSDWTASAWSEVDEYTHLDIFNRILEMVPCASTCGIVTCDVTNEMLMSLWRGTYYFYLRYKIAINALAYALSLGHGTYMSEPDRSDVDTMTFVAECTWG